MSNYTVKKGDGWYKIAKNLGVNVNDLLKANNATLDTIIHPGQILKSSNKLVAKSDKQYKHMNGLQMDWKSYGDEQQAQQNEFKDKFITPTLQKVTKMSKQADKEINRYNSRKKQLLAKHKNDPIPLNTYKNKADISKLQDQLYSLGYLKGSYNKAVDGVWGDNTQAAYDAAVAAGYFPKQNNENKNLFTGELKPNTRVATTGISANSFFGDVVRKISPRQYTAAQNTVDDIINAPIKRFIGNITSPEVANFVMPTKTYNENDLSSEMYTFLQDVADRKWNPADREKYFQKNPNAKIYKGFHGRVGNGVKESDYQKLYGVPYEGPMTHGIAKTMFGDGIYQSQGTLGSFGLVYTKDGVDVIDDWNFKGSNNFDTSSATGVIRQAAEKMGSQENSDVTPIRALKARIKYK